MPRPDEWVLYHIVYQCSICKDWYGRKPISGIQTVCAIQLLREADKCWHIDEDKLDSPGDYSD